MCSFVLHHGDCLDVLAQLAPQSVDLVLADIPYGRTAATWDKVINIQEMWQQIKRIRRSHCAVVLFAMQPFTSFLIVSNVSEFKYSLFWDKKKTTGFGNVKHQPLRASEDICVFSHRKSTYNPQMILITENEYKRMNTKDYYHKNDQKVYNKGLDRTRARRHGSKYKYPTNVIRINALNATARERVGHPTQKPVALLEYLIRTYSNPGDVVLDFTMGSGSTGEAAANTGRSFVGVELYPLADKPVDKKTNPNYFFDAEQRIAAAYARARAEQQMMMMTD